jgi:hypothetical protein
VDDNRERTFGFHDRMPNCLNLCHPHVLSLIGGTCPTNTADPIVLTPYSESCSLEDVLERIRRQSNAETCRQRVLLNNRIGSSLNTPAMLSITLTYHNDHHLQSPTFVSLLRKKVIISLTNGLTKSQDLIVLCQQSVRSSIRQINPAGIVAATNAFNWPISLRDCIPSVSASAIADSAAHAAHFMLFFRR